MHHEMGMSCEYSCPHCGALVDTCPDPGGGLVQETIEDCPICCHPNRITAVYKRRERDYEVHASTLSD